MVRTTFIAGVIGAFVLAAGLTAAADSQQANLAGRWRLNREASEFPKEVGFGQDFLSASAAASMAAGTAGAATAASAPFIPARQSLDDAKREALLVRLVKDPSPHLSIAQTESALTITDDRGRALTLHPDGRPETQSFADVYLTTTTRWEADRLVVRYQLAQERELRYTLSRSGQPARLDVQVALVERGGHETMTRVYDAAPADEPPSPGWDRPPAPPKPVPDGPVNVNAELGRPITPAPSPQATPVVAQGPGGELKGLTALGVVVEDLSSQAAGCGLQAATLDAAVTKSFRDAGLTVRPDSDEDTYVYVRVITSSASNGLCVSRYDVFLYTHTVGALPYQTGPQLLQVQLLHKAGLAGSSAASHADAVLKGVKQSADDIAARIKDANK